MGIFEKPIVAITGSNGKTTTKEMLAAIFQYKWNTFKSRSNMNTLSNIQGYEREIDTSHQAIVLEFGTKGKNYLNQFCQHIQPNISIITMIGHTHIGYYFDGLSGIAAAKSELIKGMHQNGLLLLNADDENSKLLQFHDFKGKIIKVSILSPQYDYYASCIQYLETGMRFQVTLDGSKHTFEIPVWGEHNVINALFAIAVSHFLKLNIEDIKKGLLNYDKPPHRLCVQHFGSVSLIDDSFNASLESNRAALDILSNVGKGIKAAILGNIIELGNYSNEVHKQIGKYVAQKKIDYLFTYGDDANGDDAKLIAEGARENGFPSNKIIHSSTRPELHYHISTINNKILMNTILVKGANRLKMFETVSFLCEYFFAKSKLKDLLANK